MPIMPVIQWLQHYWIVVVFIVFSLLFAITYWPGSKPTMQRHGRIPLEDDR